jgi:8-oxo-dGTP diphosphatase
MTDSNEGELRWIDNDKLLSLELWEGDRVFLPWLEHPGFFSGKFVYENGTLVAHQVNFYD